MSEEVILGVSDFVALVNQTFEYAFGSVLIVGELANYRVSKNKWVYFDLKDEFASVKFFGTVFSLPGPLEEGMILEVRGNPKLHPQFGFSVTVQSMRPVGEGSIKKAANLLEGRLRAEGLFDESRKRPLPFPPATIALITSRESAAYADFIKILNHRWVGLEINLIDVQVQGESSSGQIVDAIEKFNRSVDQPDVLVIIRGGGSADDLQSFSTEQVTRAVAASRIPTMVAIGHEIDTSLAELAADMRASTPSNAAELLVPDRRDVRRRLADQSSSLTNRIDRFFSDTRLELISAEEFASKFAAERIKVARTDLAYKFQLTNAYDPKTPLKRGYAIIRQGNGMVLRSGKKINSGDIVNMQFVDADATAKIQSVKIRSGE